MMSAKIIILSALLVSFMAVSSEAGWLYYHEPEFNGKIIDIDTKKPIEGAVVVVEYKKETLGMGAGNYSTVIGVRETLTDREGKFHFPTYTTIIQPFSWQDHTVFVIFKPGYASIELGLKDYFIGEKKNEQDGSWPDPELRMLQYRIHGTGTVEHPKLKTREQRLKTIPSSPTDIRSKELPLLYKAINEEGRRFGLGEVK